MAPVAAKFVEQPQVHIVESGIVRSTVFPNKLRDLRREAGYEMLTDFIRETGLEEISYIRLAKIERGQIFARPDEIIEIAKLLNVDPMSLFIDTAEKDFDRETWARDHTEASLTFRGGTREDMRIGAALRIRRRELGLSTTDLKKKYGMPAATASRIENAERPFHRWPDKTRKAIARMMGGASMRDIARSVTAYEQEGRLDAMMAELFSQQSLDQRHNASLLALVQKLPGKRAEKFAAKLEKMMTEKGLVDWSSNLSLVAAAEEPDIVSEDQTMPVLEGKTHDGWTMLSETKKTFTRNFEGPGIALKLDKPVLGMGIPTSALLVFELIDRFEVKGEMVLALIDGPRVRVVSARPAGRGFKLAQVNPEWQSSLSKESNVRVAKLSQIEMA
ncbi:MAG: hypothetical protein CL820_12395 [Croceicoccus sp.]|nr:hypothetical protein [Croceicoccus sp.]MAL26663.1 hypothetical protein [Croceicoccus sp.]